MQVYRQRFPTFFQIKLSKLKQRLPFEGDAVFLEFFSFQIKVSSYS